MDLAEAPWNLLELFRNTPYSFKQDCCKQVVQALVKQLKCTGTSAVSLNVLDVGTGKSPQGVALCGFCVSFVNLPSIRRDSVVARGDKVRPVPGSSGWTKPSFLQTLCGFSDDFNVDPG